MTVIQLPDEPNSILIVRLSHLGDVITTLPLVAALKQRWPRARVAWAVERSFAPLLRGAPGIDTVIEHDRTGGLRAGWRFRGALRAFGADLALDAQGNAKSALWTLASGARCRVGFAAGDWQEPWAASFVPLRAPALGRERHAVERVLALAKFVTGSEADATFELGLTPAELQRGQARWLDLAGTAGTAVCVHASVPDDPRGWPTESWSALCRQLTERGYAVVLLAGPRESACAAAIPDDATAGRWVGAKDLREFAALLAVARAAGAQFVGVDSGPMHLAAAVGLQPTALFGPTDPRRTGAWPYVQVRSLRAPDSPDCAPCIARRCSHPQGAVCMTRISPDHVLTTLEQVRAD